MAEEVWQPIAVHPKGITVTWQEKYGARREEACIGLWCSEDKNRYLLTWKDSKKVFIEAANITEIRFSKNQ